MVSRCWVRGFCEVRSNGEVHEWSGANASELRPLERPGERFIGRVQTAMNRANRVAEDVEVARSSSSLLCELAQHNRVNSSGDVVQDEDETGTPDDIVGQCLSLRRRLGALTEKQGSRMPVPVQAVQQAVDDLDAALELAGFGHVVDELCSGVESRCANDELRWREISSDNGHQRFAL